MTQQSISGEHMLILVGGLVLYHEVMCEDGELITDVVRDTRRNHPAVVSGIVLTTAAHLLGWLPRPTDPYVWVSWFTKKMKGSK